MKHRCVLEICLTSAICFASGCIHERYAKIQNGYFEPIVVSWNRLVPKNNEYIATNVTLRIQPGRWGRILMGEELFTVTTEKGRTWHYNHVEKQTSKVASRFWNHKDYFCVWPILWPTSTIKLHIDQNGYLWVVSDNECWNQESMQPPCFPLAPIGKTDSRILSPRFYESPSDTHEANEKTERNKHSQSRR